MEFWGQIPKMGIQHSKFGTSAAQEVTQLSEMLARLTFCRAFFHISPFRRAGSNLAPSRQQ